MNPAAGHRTAGPDDLDAVIKVLRDAGFALDRVETDPQGLTSGDLAQRAVAERYDACIVAGGDGTVQPAAGALAGTDVVLGILPFGSYMNIAHGLGIPLKPLEAAELITKRRVRNADGGVVRERAFFEIAGVGLDAELMGAARHVEGGRWYRALRRVWRYATHGTHRVTVDVDGNAHHHRVMQMLVLNSPYYGWSLPLLPDAEMDDGKLDVAVFPRMGRVALLRGVIALMRMQRLPQKPVRYQGARITVKSDAPLTIHADGKVVGTTPATFECRRGILKVFA